jgi:hypothetical protein
MARFADSFPQGVPPIVDESLLALFSLRPWARERNLTLMTKSLDTISEAIRNPKHPFPQVADRPDKPHKNRYERRKVKQYIHLGNWAAEAQ